MYMITSLCRDTTDTCPSDRCVRTAEVGGSPSLHVFAGLLCLPHGFGRGSRLGCRALDSSGVYLQYSLVIIYLLALLLLTIPPIPTQHTQSSTMATQRLSNVLSHITPGSKTPLEQMYAPFHSFPHFFPRPFTSLSHSRG